MGSANKSSVAASLLGNLVLYILQGFSAEKKPLLKPVFSCDANDPFANAKMNGAFAREMQKPDCNHAELFCVHEYREADEAGTLTKTEYAFYDPATGTRGDVKKAIHALFEGAK